MGIACLITNTDLFRMLTFDVGMFCGHISRDDGMTSLLDSDLLGNCGK